MFLPVLVETLQVFDILFKLFAGLGRLEDVTVCSIDMFVPVTVTAVFFFAEWTVILVCFQNATRFSKLLPVEFEGSGVVILTDEGVKDCG